MTRIMLINMRLKVLTNKKRGGLKVHKIKIFLASILKFVLFLY
jgi:hypothetical protein